MSLVFCFSFLQTGGDVCTSFVLLGNTTETKEVVSPPFQVFVYQSRRLLLLLVLVRRQDISQSVSHSFTLFSYSSYCFVYRPSRSVCLCPSCRPPICSLFICLPLVCLSAVSLSICICLILLIVIEGIHPVSSIHFTTISPHGGVSSCASRPSIRDSSLLF